VVLRGEQLKSQPQALNDVGLLCPCQRAVWVFTPANTSAVSKKRT